MTGKNMKIVTVLLIMMVVLLSACESKKETAIPTSAATTKTDAGTSTPATPKTVKVYIQPAPNENIKAVRIKMREGFEKKYPGYKVEWLEGDTAVEGGKLTTMLNSGVQLPDVINISTGPGRIQALASTNLIMPLDDLYASNGWQAKINPVALQDMKYNADKIYEVPNTIDSIQVYYHKDVFEKLGIQVPKTGAEFDAALKKIKVSGVTPLALGARNGYAIGWMFGNILNSVAGKDKVANILADKAKWNDPDAVKAATVFSDWVKAGYIDKESATVSDTDAQARFLDKKHTMIIIGAWFHPAIVAKQLQDSVGMFPLPSYIAGGTAYPTGGLGNSWVIPAQVKDLDPATKWMEFILSKEYADVMAANPSADSIIPSVAAQSSAPVSHLLEQSIKSLANGSGFNPSVFMKAEVKDAYYQNLTGIVGGLVTPQKAMDNILAGDAKDKAAAKK